MRVLALGYVEVRVRVSGGRRWQPLDAGREAQAAHMLDGLVAATSFMILTVMGDFGAHSTGSLPRSGIPAVEITYSLLELLVVVAVMVMAMLYRPGQPYRANYLLLAGGLVTMAASDRVAAYLDRVGLEQGNSLGGIGFVIGPLLIAYAMLEYPAPGTDADRRADLGMDAAQLILPYVGFLGIAPLFASHALTGPPSHALALTATQAMSLPCVIPHISARLSLPLIHPRP